MNRSQLQILAFLAAVLLLGALLAPPLYWGGKWLAEIIVSFKQAETPVIGWIGHKLTAHQFDSYYNRAFLVSALGLLWPFLRWMRLSGDPMGLEKNPSRLRDVVAGFLMAAGFLAVMALLLIWWGAYAVAENIAWRQILPRAMLSAVAVALLEEWVFRGIFLGVALRASRPWVAIVIVSALFSILHLTKAPDIIVQDPQMQETANAVRKGKTWPAIIDELAIRPAAFDWMTDPAYAQFAPSHIHWGSGFAMTAAIFKKNSRPALFLSEFLTLFAIGCILARARCKTRSLWLPIGLHAGWIFANTLFMGLTKETARLIGGKYDVVLGGTNIPLIGRELKIGLLPLGVLFVTAVAVEWWMARRVARRVDSR